MDYKALDAALAYLNDGIIDESYIIEMTDIELNSFEDIKAFNKELNKWKYGVLINGKVYTKSSDIDWSKYKTIPIELIDKYHIGICWDFVNYEYYYFNKNHIPTESYLFVMQKSDDPDDIVTHTFIIFKYEGKKYWFESSWFGHQGVHEVSGYKDVIKELVDKYGKHSYSIYKYDPKGMDKNITNGEFFKKATRNLVYDYKEKSINETLLKLEVVDCTNITIQESSLENRNIYKERNLYPIYIILSFSYTAFGKVERAIKNVKYSHAGLALDSNLKSIFTFSFNKQNNGFNAENLDRYIGNSDKAVVSVLAIFVDLNIKNKINKTLSNFKKNKDHTKYGFGNLANVILNKAAVSNDTSLICSQFVDIVLKSAGINLTNKSSNLVIPQDFDSANNPKIYKLYEGLAKDYNEKQIERNITGLINDGTVTNINN